MAVEPKMPEQAHQVVGHHDEAEGGLRGPKVLQAERIEPEVLEVSVLSLKHKCGWLALQRQVGAVLKENTTHHPT